MFWHFAAWRTGPEIVCVRRWKFCWALISGMRAQRRSPISHHDFNLIFAFIAVFHWRVDTRLFRCWLTLLLYSTIKCWKIKLAKRFKLILPISNFIYVDDLTSTIDSLILFNNADDTKLSFSASSTKDYRYKYMCIDSLWFYWRSRVIVLWNQHFENVNLTRNIKIYIQYINFKLRPLKTEFNANNYYWWMYSSKWSWKYKF